MHLESPLNDKHLRSNTPALFVGWGLLFAAGIAAYRLQSTMPEHVALSVALVGLAMPFLSIGLFELWSGYTWRNLTVGNRGVSRAEHPTKFLTSMGLHLLVSLTILGFALWKLVGEQ